MTETTEVTVPIRAEPLRQLLQAMNGPGHLIRELQAIRQFGDGPIDQVIADYNAGVQAHNEASKDTTHD